MKPAYVADLGEERAVTSFFLVCEKEVRTTRDGKAYLRLELGDCTGTIEARMWDATDAASSTFHRDDIIKVQGRVELYRGKRQMVVEKTRRAEPGEVDLGDYFPHTKQDVEQLYAELQKSARSVGDPWLRQLVESTIGDPEIIPKLKRAPAAKSMHHAYLGGLLEHVVSLCALCRVVAGHYPEVNSDLLMTGAILHDIGKIDELTYERSFGYSAEGHLLGHILMEIEQIGRKMDAIEGFPAELKALVKHLLASHHGRYEFGSPKLPMIREALLLHYLDDLDSKMAAARDALSSEAGDDAWTAWNPALERRLLRLDKFWKPAGAEPQAAEQLAFEPPGKSKK